jgi:hypothetical protein
MDNNKAQMNSIILMVVIFFVVAFIFLLTNFIQYKVNDAIETNIKSSVGMDNRTQTVYNKVDSVRGLLDYFLLSIFFALVIAVLIASYNTRSPAIMLAGFILLIIVAIVFSWIIKGVYLQLYDSFTPVGMTYPMSFVHSIMSRLPLYTLLLGAISAILMFGIPKNAGDY